MDAHADRGSAETIEGSTGDGASNRVDEERARQILARAAALDAERSSEIEVAQLREAAAAAGISPLAFDQALREQSRGAPASGRHGMEAIRAPGSAEVARYAALIRDLLGDEARVTVVEDRIEGRDEDGVTVSINPAHDATVSIVAEGSLKRRLVAIVVPALIPAFFGFLLALEEEDVGIGLLLGVLMAVIASVIGIVGSHRREKRSLEKKTDRLRRQLQRMLPVGPVEL